MADGSVCDLATGLEIGSVVNNTLSPLLGRTTVWFITGGVLLRAAIAAVTPNQINVFVPFEAGFNPTVDVQVEVDQLLSNVVTMPVTAVAPGLSQPILNQDGTLNSAANPAPRGSIISLYGTGLGAMSPQPLDGYLAISTPYSMPINAPVVSIGGQPATLQYAS